MVLDYELMGRLIKSKHGQTMIDLHRLWSASTDCTKPCKKIHILNRITGEWGIGGMPDASQGRLSWGNAVPFTWQWGTVKRQSRISRKLSRLIHFILRKRGNPGLACGQLGNSRMVKPFTGSSSGLSVNTMKIIEEMKLRLVGLPSPYHFERPVPRNHSGCQNILWEMSQSHNAEGWALWETHQGGITARPWHITPEFSAASGSSQFSERSASYNPGYGRNVRGRERRAGD